MQGLLYGNISDLSLTRKLDRSVFTFPEVVAGTKLIPKLRLSQDIEGQVELADRKVHSLKAQIGNVGAAPERGEFQLKLGVAAESAGVNTTGKLAFDISDTDFAAALNALTDPLLLAYLPCTVATQDGARRVKFLDNSVEVLIECVDNELWPPSFVNADAVAFDEGYIHIIEWLQTPVAAEAKFTTIVPKPPKITQKQSGDENDGVKVNEIQHLFIPPEFAQGAIQIKRAFALTDVIGFPTSADEILEKLVPLADDGGLFKVYPAQNGVYIEFSGEMGGQGQDLLEVVVFDAPAADITFILNTNTEGMRSLMRRPNAEGKVETRLELSLELEDEQVVGLYHLIKWQADLIFNGSVLDDERNVAADLKWNQPVSRKDALAHSPDSVMVGHRSHREVIGNGVAVSFAINHNLGTNPVTFVADASSDVLTSVNHRMSNGDIARVSSAGVLPAPLVAGTDYYVVNRTPDSLKLSLTLGGAAIDLTDAGTGVHTVTRNETTEAGVHVTVYDLVNSNRRVPDDEYELNADTENSLTLSGFAAAPSVNQYAVFITLIGQPATYQEHTHTQDEIIGLNDRLLLIEAAIAELQLLAPSATTFSLASTAEKVVRWDLPEIFSVYPSRKTFDRPEGERGLMDLVYPSGWRAGGLLPAVHDAAVVDLSTILVGGLLPAASGYNNEVWLHDGADVIAVAGAGSRRSVDLSPGEWLASNGVVWFRVTPYNRAAAVTFAADTASDVLTSVAQKLVAGNVVQVSSTGVLPAPLVAATDYYVVTRDTADGVQLSATAGGAVLDLTTVGTGVHSIGLQDKVTYYPTDFEHELFRFDVSESQLVLNSKLELQVGLALAMLPPVRKRRVRESSAQWAFVLEIGNYPQVSSPSGAGMNLGDPVWDPNPVLEERIIVGPVANTHLFGLEVIKNNVAGVPTLSLNKILYGQVSAAVPPGTMNFAVRGRLVKFDTEDSISDARGAVVIEGLSVRPGIGAKPDPLGFARIV